MDSLRSDALDSEAQVQVQVESRSQTPTLITEEAHEWLSSYLETRACQECGEADQRCLCFCDPTASGLPGTISVATLLSSGAGVSEIEDRARQCIILCANCQLLRDPKPVPTYEKYRLHKHFTPKREREYRELRANASCVLCGRGMAEFIGFYSRTPEARTISLSKAAQSLPDDEFKKALSSVDPLCRNCYLKAVRSGLTMGQAIELGVDGLAALPRHVGPPQQKEDVKRLR